VVISKENAEHYIWGGNCDGWHLVKQNDLSVIHERMPSGASEVRHFHNKSRQFFFVLWGTATLEFNGVRHEIGALQGIEVPPGVPHQMMNQSQSDVELLVISQPMSHGDRITVEGEARKSDGSVENLSVDNFQFDYICDIIPDELDGKVKTFFPQYDYENKEALALHQYGAGPFCRFMIPKLAIEGVYIIQVNDVIRYVGECEDLSNRFNMGYGNISPRNCFVGGQTTNCRINHHIYMAANENSEIKLYFHEANDRFEVERILIEKLNSEWNISRGKFRPAKQVGRSETEMKRDAEVSKIREHSVKDDVGQNRRSSCRDEVLLAAQSIVKRKGTNRFTVQEVVDHMKVMGTTYPESTIRTHVTSRCCMNAPNNHATVFADFERIDRGVYRLHRFEL